jgi:hypothetical protein
LLQLFTVQTADFRDFPLNHVFLHNVPPLDLRKQVGFDVLRVDVKRACHKMADLPLYVGD